MRVLVVDDSSEVRGRLVSLLEELGPVDSLMEAGSVAEAQRLLSESKADLVVLDMRLPDGDGLEVLRAAKRLRPEPAVVVLTNYPYDELRAACLAAGADGFLDKRTEFSRLPALVSELGRRAEP
jgi:CheY-like chemotaxis protein